MQKTHTGILNITNGDLMLNGMYQWANHGSGKNRQFVIKTCREIWIHGRYNHNLEISPFERSRSAMQDWQIVTALLGYDIIAHRGYPVYQNSNPRINPDQQNASFKFFTIFNKYTVGIALSF